MLNAKQTKRLRRPGDLRGGGVVTRRANTDGGGGVVTRRRNTDGGGGWSPGGETQTEGGVGVDLPPPGIVWDG